MSTTDDQSRELLAKRTRLENERDDLVARQLDATVTDAGIAERIERLNAGIDRVKADLVDVNAERAAEMREGLASGRLRVAPGSDMGDDGYADWERSTTARGWTPQDEGRSSKPARSDDRAMRLVDAAVSRGLPAAAGEKTENLIRSGGSRERATATRWVEATGTEAYLRAFAAVVADPTRGHMLWNDQERDAFKAAEEFRAMSLTDNAGGYMVPFQLDPSIMLTSDGSIDPIRQIARTVQTTSDTWNGVSSAGVTAEWLAEATEAADAAPTLAQPSVPTYKGSAFVPFSFEVGMDAVDLTGELGPLLSDAADNLMAAAHATGSGSGQPTGIVTALTGGSSVVASATTDTFAEADVYALIEALPPRFRPRAEWIAALPTLNTIDQFETSNGARLFDTSSGSLLRRPIWECSGLDGSITADSDNFIAVVGDWSHYVIADRIGTTVELIPNLMGANNRPTGQRGLFMWFRTGGDSIVDPAFSMLNVT